MSATDAAAWEVAKLLPRAGETVEQFARRGYQVQMNVYSAYAMGDLSTDFDLLSERDRNGWLRWARARMV
jgi:hypothetical protein